MTPYVAMTAACTLVALLFLSWTGALRSASDAYIQKTMQDLPDRYQEIALREIEVTRRLGIPVTRREADHIVGIVRTMAREHGVPLRG